MSDLLIPQGKTWRVAYPILGSFDPAGWMVRSQVRARAASPDVLHEWSTAAGDAGFETVPADQLAAAGHPTSSPLLCVVLTVAPATSAAWTWTSGVYDIEASDGAAVLLIADGTVRVRPEVTR